MLSKLTLAALSAILFCATGARAEDITSAAIFSFSGFGTLGLVHSSEHKADFTNGRFKPNGAGYSQSWSPDIDSLIAAQLTANLSSKLTGIVQVLSEQEYDGSYRPHVEWGNLKYQFTPDFSVRVGRVVMPSYLLSASRKVSYANPWVRPPIEVYHLVPITTNDGVDASYRFRQGELTHTIQAIYGKVEATFPDRSIAIAKNQSGIFAMTEYGGLTIRVAYHQTHLNLTGPRVFFDIFRQFGPEGDAIADQYDCNGKLIQFRTFGINYDPGPWFLMGEGARSISHCMVGDQIAWYVSAGRRINKFTPYLTYGEVRSKGNTSNPGLTVSNLPPFLAGPAAGLNAGLNEILASIPTQKTITLGTRWDFSSNAALKLQLDHTRIGAGSPGVLRNFQPGFQPGGKIKLLSVTVDFVF